MRIVRRILAATVGIAFMALAVLSCSDSGSEPPAQVAAGLTATPSSVTVGSGSSQTVSIGGGKAPYAITQPPSAAYARAIWTDSTTTPATMTIIGTATVATGSTSVRVKDSSPSPEKQVEIPIRKN